MSFTKDETMDIKLVKAACYSIIMLISLIGNSSLIAIVARYKHTQTTTNLLIANMAISDLMVSAFAVPRKLAQIFTGVQRWLIDGTAGVILCKLVYFFQDISTAVSIQSILFITVDRYAGVVQPYREPIITPRRRRVLIPLIWLIAMGLHGNYFYTVRLKQVNNIRYCIFSWEPAFDSLLRGDISYLNCHPLGGHYGFIFTHFQVYTKTEIILENSVLIQKAKAKRRH